MAEDYKKYLDKEGVKYLIDNMKPCYIRVTCDEEMAGMDVIAVNGEESHVRKCPTEAPYEVEFAVKETGRWDISCGDFSAFVEVTDYTIYYVKIETYGYKGWLDAAGMSDTFGSLEAVLADEKALRELCTKHASADYLALWCNKKPDDARTLLNNDYLAKWINLRDYCLDKLYSYPDVKTVMNEVDKYGYGEWTLVSQVPRMNGNSTIHGTVLCNSASSSFPGYYAFTNRDLANNSGWWSNNTPTNVYIGYQFKTPILIDYVSFYPSYDNGQRVKAYTIQASDDGTKWDDLYSGTNPNSDVGMITIKLNINKPYLCYRLYITQNYLGSGYGTGVRILHLYKWGYNGVIPFMTSNTAPYGKASVTSESSSTPAYNAVDTNMSTYASLVSSASTGAKALKYEFNMPTNVKKALVNNASENAIYQNCEIRASNDGTNWDTVSEVFDMSPKELKYVTVNTSKYYLHYSIFVASTSVSSTTPMYIFQLYGRQLNVSVPKMTSNTAPYGEASSSTNLDSTYVEWRPFDGGSGKSWIAGNGITTNSYVQYDFKKPVTVKYLHLLPDNDTTTSFNRLKDFILQGSNDGINFEDIFSATAAIATKVENLQRFVFDNDKSFRIYRMYCKNSYSSSRIGIRILQFFGLDYSEREFAEGSTTKYLYDHGIEFENFTSDGYYQSQQGPRIPIIKGFDKIINVCSSVAGHTGIGGTDSKINFNPFNKGFANAKIISTNNNMSIGIYSSKDLGTARIGSISFPSESTQNGKYLLYGDLSSVNSEYYIATRTFYTDGNTAKYQNFETYELWME